MRFRGCVPTDSGEPVRLTSADASAPCGESELAAIALLCLIFVWPGGKPQQRQMRIVSR